MSGGSVVALLRGMNVGKNRFPMADLRAALAGAGLANPRTLLASGNVVVEGPATAEIFEQVIAEAFGIEMPVIVRSGHELADALAASPFADVATDGARHFIAFAAEPIDEEVATVKLAGKDWGEERWAVRGREVYLWLPGGMGDSPLAVAFGKPPLGPATTVRNVNTVAKLVAMAT